MKMVYIFTKEKKQASLRYLPEFRSECVCMPVGASNFKIKLNLSCIWLAGQKYPEIAVETLGVGFIEIHSVLLSSFRRIPLWVWCNQHFIAVAGNKRDRRRPSLICFNSLFPYNLGFWSCTNCGSIVWGKATRSSLKIVSYWKTHLVHPFKANFKVITKNV